MELRPGYKKTDVGVIPDDWHVLTLREVLLSNEVGGNYPNSTAPSLFPLMKMGNVSRGHFDLSKIEFVSSGIVPHKNHLLQKGDVIFNTRNTLDLVGKIAVWREEIPIAYFNSNLMRLQFDPTKISSHEYANLTLNTDTTLSGLRAMATGTTSVAAIYTRDLLGLPIIVPPRSEQKAIAESLSDVDASIAALSRLIAKKRDLRRGAMQRLLTGRTRLPGFSAPWQEKRLGDHVAFLKNGIQSRAQLTLDDPVRYLHYGDIHVSADLSLDLRKTAMPRLPSLAAAGLTRLKDGDVVFVDASEDLNGVGKSLEILGANGIEAVSGQHTIAARFDKSVLADGYKCYLQFTPSFTTHLRRLAAGTKVYATNRQHIASAELRLPEPDEQIAIAQVFSDMETEISVLETRLDKTRALKQAMMQALLTGRVRLPVPRDAASQMKEAAHA
ncbi:MAG TPA: restriction endonuclease subunit S [Hyphomicrobium sp.]|jgi:type I restriction enzyme S subunit